MTHRVLHLLGSAQVEGAAQARLVGTLAGGLAGGRYALHAWFLDGGGPLAAELRDLGVPVRVVRWSRKLSDAPGAWEFVRALRGERYAIVHQHIGGRLLSWVARRATGAAIICHFHSRVIEADSIVPQPLRAPNADAVIAVSNAVAQNIVGAKPRVIPIGVPVAHNGYSAASSDASSAIIGTACRLVPVKGLQYLLRAVALLKPIFPQLGLEIAGAGGEQPALEAEAARLGIDKDVSFLGWHRDLPALLARWQIFALPSLDEGCPVAVLEAMAMGLPVVASAAGGLPEVVQDERTGYLVPAADAPALAERLGILLRDAQLRRTMGAAGRNRVIRHFSADAMIRAIEAIYDENLKGFSVR